MTDHYVSERVSELREVAAASPRIKIGRIDLNELARRAADLLEAEYARASKLCAAETDLYVRIDELETELAAYRRSTR